jgi:RNA polymerase sigma-70 factor, ECF subfamily
MRMTSLTLPASHPARMRSQASGDASSGGTDESLLVAQAQRGDERAFEALFQRTSGRVFALCLRMTGDRQRARDLAHDAFVRAWERLDSYRGEAAFTTWMHRLTVNVVLEQERADRRRRARVSVEADGADENVVDEALAPPAPDADARIDLERAMEHLPPNARRVFVLHAVEGYRHGEIAVMLGTAEGTVRAHLHRARKLLLRWMTP